MLDYTFPADYVPKSPTSTPPPAERAYTWFDTKAPKKAPGGPMTRSMTLAKTKLVFN